ncbi:MAG: S8 family serine peptidase [Candidatus Sericytochromatia bacterium]|nr:S8 family serine peptidase [Candidatus Sericytochromatia bacterium]
MPLTAANAFVTWARGAARGLAVQRAADTHLARVQLRASAAQDGTPSAVVALGRDVVLLSGAALRTASAVARNPDGLRVGERVTVEGETGTVLHTDDGFAEIEARSVVVAVVDTGVDVHHPALVGRCLPGWNAVDGSSDVSDAAGHGTHVAGKVAGLAPRPGDGGVAPGVTLLPIKAVDAQGRFSDASIAAGIRHAVARGARVVNLSLRSDAPLPLTAGAIAAARRAGVLVVAASGNEGRNAVTYPAAYPGVLVVGSADAGRRSPFSNGGARLDLVAPGERIRSAEAGAYRERSGTSMASPQVAGAAALVMARNPHWTAEQVATWLQRTARDLGQPGRDVDFGAGVLDLFAAVHGAPGPAPAAAGAWTISW